MSADLVPYTGPDTQTDAESELSRMARLGRRVLRGLREAPGEVRAWRKGTEYDQTIALAKEAKDQARAIVAQDRKDDAIHDRAKTLEVARRLAIAVMGGGWIWATLALTVRAGIAWLIWRSTDKDAKARHCPKARQQATLRYCVSAAVVSWVLTVIDGMLGVRVSPLRLAGHRLHVEAAWSVLMLAWPTLAALIALIVVVIWVGPDGKITDNLPAEDMAPAEVEVDDRPQIVKAVMATRKLPAGTEPKLVEPGVLPGNDGQIWTAAVDTGGPSATALLDPRARRELAAQLGLSERRLLLTVDEDCGARIHLTGIVGEPFRTERHPLLSMPQVDIWDGIPFGPAITGARVMYQVDGVNSLFGGDSGAGKSMAAACVWGGFVLSPQSRIWAIDGGEVDTEPLRRSGVATAWTTELAEAVEILREVLAEVDKTQHALARAGLRKVTSGWFAEHGGAHDLLLIDELATFTQRKGDKLAEKFVELLRPIIQRSRKTGKHVLLSTQSPSVDALDADARDVIPVRWCGRTRSIDLAAKVLGRGTIGHGVDPRSLPKTKGVGWYSTPDGDVVVRPYALADDDLAEICRRGAELRRNARSDAAPDESRQIVDRVSALIREHGVDVPAGRVMRTRDVADRLGVEPMVLPGVLAEHGIRSKKVRRTDDPDSDNRMHYVLSDFPVRRFG